MRGLAPAWPPLLLPVTTLSPGIAMLFLDPVSLHPRMFFSAEPLSPGLLGPILGLSSLSWHRPVARASLCDSCSYWSSLI